MNTSRTDNASYNQTPAWKYVEPTDSQLKIEAEIEDIEEYFVFCDDKTALYEKASDIVEFDDDLKESLLMFVVKAIGTDKVQPFAIDQFIKQLQKTVKSYATSNVESE